MVEEGEAVSLRCLSQGFPLPSNTWSRMGGDLPEQVVLQSDGAQLVFTDSSEEDAGTYVCTATNAYGSVDQQYVVQVLPSTSPPTGTTTAPTSPQNGTKFINYESATCPTCLECCRLLHTLSVPPLNVTVEGQTALEEGTDLILTCSAAGNPEPGYMWIRAGDRLPSKVVNPFSSQLVVPSVTWSDVGLYYCLAINTAGATQSQAVYVLLQARQGSVISNREQGMYIACLVHFPHTLNHNSLSTDSFLPLHILPLTCYFHSLCSSFAESAEGINMNLVGGIFGVIFSVVLLVSGVVGFVTCFTFGQNRCVMIPAFIYLSVYMCMSACLSSCPSLC